MPFFNVYFSLERHGGVPAMSNCFIALTFLVMLTDWRNTIAMLLTGIALASGVYFATHPDGYWPKDMLAQIPAYLVVLVGGGVFKLSEKQIDAEKARLASALAGSIAHEMRNPLSRILQALRRMQGALPPPSHLGSPGALDAVEAETLYTGLAESELAVRRGLQVISMTLDEVSEKPMDSTAFSYLSAADVTEQAVREFSYDSEDDQARVSVDVTEDFTFRGDETAYLFVLFNLIKNSLYYVPQCPGLRVTISVGPQEVRVSDSGPGMSPHVLKGLFEPFRSVGKIRGTGLGLPYCKRVMQSFGGSIQCESELGRGTTFVLRFPAMSEAEGQAHRRAVLDKARDVFAGQRILIVEDDAAQRVTSQHKLRPLQALVDEAADGQRALELLARNSYALVLLDLNMPVMDGYTLAEKIRNGEVPMNRDVRIVAYTSEPAHVARVKVQKAGMDGFISKPAAQLPLLQALHNAMLEPRRNTGPGGPLAGRRIILADDSPYNRRAVAAYLRNAGAVVAEAGQGAAVLDLLRLGGADAVLMDLQMPGLSGTDAARAIRGSGEAWAGVPIVALTAHSDAAAMETAHSAGMNGFLVKPVEAGLLYETLLAAIGSSARAAEPASAPGAELPGLLNIPRLDSYRRLGLLDELLADYVPEIARLVATLNRVAIAREMEPTIDALHSLLGMSGEAGALLLHQRVRQVYVPMLERREWPSEPGWVGQLAGLARQTEQALLAYAADASRAGAV
jgi:CheY-like chemotaxis protein